MTLQKQLLDLPITGGLDQKTDSLITQKPLQLNNCLYRKSGVLSKRYGYTAIGQYNLRTDGTTPPEAEHLCTFGPELLRIGNGAIDTYHTAVSGKDWLGKGRISEATVLSEPVVSADNISDPDIAIYGTWAIMCYAVFNLENNIYTVYCDVIDTATNEKIVVKSLIGSGTAPNITADCRVIITGSYAYVFYTEYNGGTYDINYRSLNLTTLAWSAVQTLIASTNYPYDVMALGNDFVITFTLMSGTVRHITHKYNGNVATIGSYVWATADNYNDHDHTCVAVYYDATYVATAWAISTGTAYTVRTYIYNASNGAQVNGSTLENAVSTSNVITNMSISPTANNNWLVVWSREDVSPFRNMATYWNEISQTGGTVVYGYNKANWQVYAISKPFLVNNRNYLWVRNPHTTHSTYFLVDVQTNETNPWSIVFRLTATTSPRLGVHSYLWNSYNHICKSVAVGSKKFAFVAPVIGTGANATLQIYTADFNQPKRTSVEISGALVLSGGNPSQYDRDIVSELGFAWEPPAEGITYTKSSGGSMSLGTYVYRFVYEWYDAKGNRHQSAPSNTVSLTLSGSESKVVFTIPTLALTNKMQTSNTDLRKVVVRAYRTVAGGGTFYLVPESLVSGLPKYYISHPENPTVVYTDTASDVSISSQEQIYTAGGVLDNVIPPSASIVHTFKQAVFLAGTDDDSIWISKAITTGDGLAFNDGMNIEPFEGGRITALATMDNNLIVFKSNCIYAISGEPPNDLGASSLSSPQRLQSDVGCIDPKSVISTSDGVWFWAGKAGLYLLTRGFEVVPIGKSVEDSYDFTYVSSTGSFAAAVLVPKQNLLRFVQYYGSTNNCINYDYYHSKQLGTPVFSTDTWSEPVGNYYAAPRAATIWNNDFVWIGGSAGGYLYKEAINSWLDTGGANTNYISTTFETSFEKTSGINGLHRVWRVGVLGQWRANHGLTITLTSDAGTQSSSWTYTDIANLPNYTTAERVVVHSQNQKVSWMKVKVQDTDPGAAYRGNGRGFELKGVSLEVGMKQGLSKALTAASKK